MNKRFYKMHKDFMQKYLLEKDKAIWFQIKQIILKSGRFDVNEWYLEAEESKIKYDEDGNIILGGAVRLIPHLPWTDDGLKTVDYP